MKKELTDVSLMVYRKILHVSCMIFSLVYCFIIGVMNPWNVNADQQITALTWVTSISLEHLLYSLKYNRDQMHDRRFIRYNCTFCNPLSWDENDEILLSSGATLAVLVHLSAVPVGATLLWMVAAHLNLQLSLLFPQAPAEGWQLCDHSLLFIWSKQRRDREQLVPLLMSHAQPTRWSLLPRSRSVLAWTGLQCGADTECSCWGNCWSSHALDLHHNSHYVTKYMHLLTNLQSWKWVGSKHLKIWMPQGLSASDVKLGGEARGRSAHKQNHIILCCVTKLKTIFSLYLLIQKLSFLFFVPGTLWHLANLLPHPFFLLLLHFRLMDPTLILSLQKFQKFAHKLGLMTPPSSLRGTCSSWTKTQTFFCCLCSSSYSCFMRVLCSATLLSSSSSSILCRSLSSSFFRLFSSIFWQKRFSCIAS